MKSFKTLIAGCGIIGTALLIVYFTAPFTFMPLPQPNASLEEVKTFGENYHDIILADTWLQQGGTFLSIILH